METEETVFHCGDTRTLLKCVDGIITINTIATKNTFREFNNVKKELKKYGFKSTMKPFTDNYGVTTRYEKGCNVFVLMLQDKRKGVLQ